MPYVCWQCGADAPTHPLFCPACETLQPPRPGRSLFEILDVPPTLALENADLERSFKALSRRLHPDRFAGASDRERRFSLEHATALNDAWRTLRVPVKRAEYLLGLWGRPVGEESARSARLPMEFLEEVMELREQVAEARMEGSPETLQRVLTAVEARWRDLYAQVAAHFQEAESLAENERKARLEPLERELHMLRYLQGILNEYDISAEAARPGR